MFHIINDLEKNVGAVIADKKAVMTDCKRQLYDINTCLKLSIEGMEVLLAKSK